MSKHDEEYIDKHQPDGVIERHHELGPSALKYVEICPGYRSEKNVTTPWAEEGTLLHKACEDGSTDGLDDEQSKAVASCLDYVEALEKVGDDSYKEMRVEISLCPTS